jgi:hypothetical protein
VFERESHLLLTITDCMRAFFIYYRRYKPLSGISWHTSDTRGSHRPPLTRRLRVSSLLRSELGYHLRTGRTCTGRGGYRNPGWRGTRGRECCVCLRLFERVADRSRRWVWAKIRKEGRGWSNGLNISGMQPFLHSYRCTVQYKRQLQHSWQVHVHVHPLFIIQNFNGDLDINGDLRSCS